MRLLFGIRCTVGTIFTCPQIAAFVTADSGFISLVEMGNIRTLTLRCRRYRTTLTIGTDTPQEGINCLDRFSS